MKTETKLKFKKTITNLIFRFKNHDIGTQAAALSYFLLQASIPLLMVLVSVVSRVLADNQDAIFSLINLLPSSSKDLAQWVLETLIKTTSSASVTIITILFALWSATAGFDKLIAAINRAYGHEEGNKAIKQKLFSIIYTIVFIIIIVFVLISQIYGPQILDFLKNNISTIFSGTQIDKVLNPIIDTLSSPLFRIILTIVPFLIMSLALGFFYKFAPSNSKEKIPFKVAFVSGVFVTVTVFIANFLYSYFLTNFSNQSLVYGALSGILALFLWLTILSNVLIIGAELIDSYLENYEIDSKAELEEFKKEEEKPLKDQVVDIVKSSDGGKESKPSKTDLRKYYQDLRKNIDEDKKQNIDYNIYTKLLNSEMFDKAHSVFIYVSVNNEIDTINIIKTALELGKEVYVPFIDDTDSKNMKATRLYSIDDLKNGKFDIPTSYSNEYIKNPDITILQGYSFDKNKNRLGYGGGYYDRFLSKNKTTSIGLFRSEDENDEIPIENFDQKLDYIITENQII